MQYIHEFFQLVPGATPEFAERFREHLLERLAERDDEVLEDIVEGRDPPADRLRQVLRKATLDGAIFPVFCGAAYRNRGIEPLLDGVCGAVRVSAAPEGLSRRAWLSALPTLEAGGTVESSHGEFPERYEPDVPGVIVGANVEEVRQLRTSLLRDAG